MSIDELITRFIHESLKVGHLHRLDEVYVTNRLLALLEKEDYKKEAPFVTADMSYLDVLDGLVEHAVQSQIIDDYSASRDVFSAQVMDLVTPYPSQVNQLFWDYYKKDSQLATDYFFNLSKQNNYIKTREIAQNIEFTYDTAEYGELQMAINLSKPEKDPKEIALASKYEKSKSYPTNALVLENEGYAGHLTHPGRANHRIIRMDLQGDAWGFQYSPYAYYNEHSIFLALEHRPMNVGPQAIQNLLEIITQLPHYFVGSNAGLPIVGGSILSHDHYQGGYHEFPIQKATYTYIFEIPEAPSVKAGILKWPMSAIRLRGSNRDEMMIAAEKIMKQWEDYSDESVGIHAYTGKTPHNAITPIARRHGDLYELDIVLRNNRTSSDFPDGIFHPHPNVQHIKKENIGLIEVMGLAILPPRLKTELNEVKDFLLGKRAETASIHQAWANEIKENNPTITKENVSQIIEESVGEVFLKVLHHAGVFKTNATGQQAFKKFIERTLI